MKVITTKICSTPPARKKKKKKKWAKLRAQLMYCF